MARIISPRPAPGSLIRRREFLQGALGLGAIGVSGPLLSGCGPVSANYGPLEPADANGLLLPAGFTSRIVATTGAPVGSTGHVWHTDPDGGACFSTGDGGWIYVSNSESSSGGCGMIRFDAAGSIIDARSILSGTQRNCAGGTTPWGTWLSCEETGVGRVWECDPRGVAAASPRPAMGRFNHEAAAVDPATGHVYMTEDRPDGGFYRFIPSAFGDLSSGTLQVMTEMDGALGWADLPDPSASSVETRAQVAGMKPFNGGEGLWYRPTYLAFTTKGDDKVWAFVPQNGVLLVLYDRNATTTPSLSGVDNVTVPPEPAANHLFVAEDGGNMEICAVDGSHLDGTAYPFLQISGRPSSEVTGPAFSPDYTRLYFSSQRTPGETFEVAGPFKKG